MAVGGRSGRGGGEGRTRFKWVCEGGYTPSMMVVVMEDKSARFRGRTQLAGAVISIEFNYYVWVCESCVGNIHFYENHHRC